MQPIRTAAEVAVDFAVFTHDPFAYQLIAPEARRMRKLGMTLQAIGDALGVDEKTVRKVTRGVRRTRPTDSSSPRPSPKVLIGRSRQMT